MSARPRSEWLDELAQAIVEGRTDEALALLKDEYPEMASLLPIVRLRSVAKQMRAGANGDCA